MSFFTFHISIFFSASLACGALIMSEGGGYCLSGSRFCLAKVSCLESPEFLVSTLGIVLVSFLVLLKLQSGMSLRFCDEGWRSGLAGLKARGSFFDSLLPSQHFTLSLSLSLSQSIAEIDTQSLQVFYSYTNYIQHVSLGIISESD